ncbi:MAG: Gfo/Idh/MocA family oxidoreductase, partial [Bryobacteraceae bacterium]|nr:Gfo/Idh/MocA family oxidoreductase [Bryobacteraceae bacterium]
IGVGGMGTGHVRAFLNYPDVRIIAVCDVRDANAQRAKQIVDQRYGDTACAAYRDFRELLARPDIDAIVMACPDHWHVLVGLEAARRGKHMYFEKPLSMSIGENKAMRDAVRRSGVVFQFGTQQRSSENYRRACELVRNGKIGQLKTIMVGSATAPRNRVHPVQPVPAGFDYEMWLGPAPWAPYCDERCTRNWTHISDYSLGCLSGAWGIHDIDIAQWALEADHTGPVETEGRGGFMRGGLYDTAEWWEVEHRYANGVTLIHMDMPNALKRAWQFRLQWMSMLFLGSEGWIHASRQNLTTHPAGLARLTIGPNEKRVIHSNDHRRNFLDAVRSGGGTISPIEAAVRSDSVCHHAHVALRLGRKLRWDPAREEFIGDPQANRMLARPMRAPWRI